VLLVCDKKDKATGSRIVKNCLLTTIIAATAKSQHSYHEKCQPELSLVERKEGISVYVMTHHPFIKVLVDACHFLCGLLLGLDSEITVELLLYFCKMGAVHDMWIRKCRGDNLWRKAVVVTW
jgi:hypothetical protein